MRPSLQFRRQSRFRLWGAERIVGVIVLIMISSCTARAPQEDLPVRDLLQPPSGYQIARSLVHFHSPFSWDACDQKGIDDQGEVASQCRERVLEGLCENRIDFAFLTDHPDRMAEYEWPELALSGNGVEYGVDGATSLPLGVVRSCESQHIAKIAVGIEGKVSAIALRGHPAGMTVQERLDFYESGELVDLLAHLTGPGGGKVFGVHPEGKSVEEILQMSPSFIESFNLHALLDPEIRHGSLDLAPLSALPSMMSFWVDPYHQLNPDSLFLHLLELPEAFSKKWNAVIRGANTTFSTLPAWGASDSHEYLLPQKGADGRRLDAHARMFRLVVNHLLVSEVTTENVLNALDLGRGWTVFESLGSPKGMDFHFLASDLRRVETGESVSDWSLGSPGLLQVKLPSLVVHDSWKWKFAPEVRIKMYHLPLDSQEEVLVRENVDEDLTVIPSTPGSYRVEVWIVPHHMRGWAAPYSDLTREPFPWILTNRIHLRESVK